MVLEKGTTNKLLEYVSLIFKTCGGQYLFKSYQYYSYYSTTQQCDGPPVNQHEAGTIKVIKLQLPRFPCVFMHCKLGTGGLLFLNGTSFQTRMQMQMLRCEGHSIQMCCTSQHKLDIARLQPSRLRVWASRLWQLIIVLWKRLLCLKTQSTRQQHATAIKCNSNIYSTAAESTAVIVRGKYAKLELPTVNCCYN